MMPLARHFLIFLGAAVLGYSQPSAAPADKEVVVNTGDVHQTMDGFGACIVDYDLLTAYQDPGFYDRAVFDFGATILRLPMGGIEAEANDNDDPATFIPSAVDHEKMAMPMAVARQFQARGIGYIFSTLWTPPAWMKTNRAEQSGGRLRPDRRAEFAEFLEAYVQIADREYGVKVDAVSLQNELLFVEPYNSCVYNPLQLRETLRAVQQRFAADKATTQIILPEDMGMADRYLLYLEPLMADRETRAFPGFFASHGGNGLGNWRKMAANLAGFGRKFWLSETSGQNPDWRGGLALAENMHDTIVGGNASAFVYWQYSANAPDRAALFAGSEYTPKAYAAKHFVRFVRPGMQRVYAELADHRLLVSAFKHPETRDLAVILINKGDRPVKAALRLLDPQPPQRWLTFTSHEGSYLQPGTAAPTDLVEVPAQGIVTLYGRCGMSLAELPALQPSGWKPPVLDPVIAPGSGRNIDERLHAAARADNLALVKQLLAEGLDPNKLNAGKFTPLHRAAWPGHADLVKPLVSAGANPNAPDGTGGTPLFIAANNGHDAFVEALVQAGADINARNNRGQVALHQAALAGHVSTVRLLLRLGADPNLADHHGWTALHWAAACPERSSVELLQVLLQAGAKADAIDGNGMTSLHVAAANLVNSGLFLRGGRSQPGAQFVNAERLRLLVDAGAAVNARDAAGRTPLHWAAWIGETASGEDVAGRAYFQYPTEAVRYLLSVGADAKARDSAGRMPAEYAAQEGYFEAAGVLQNSRLGSGVPVAGSEEVRTRASATDRASPDPSEMAVVLSRRLVRAAAAGDVGAMRSLLKEGASPNPAGPQGRSPLHEAVIGGHLDAVRLLVAAGADVSLRDSDGYTPLERAVQNNETDIIKALRMGGDPH